MKILFLSFYPPEVLNAANERLLSFIERLSQNHQIFLITSGNNNQIVSHSNYINYQFKVVENKKSNCSLAKLFDLIVGNIDKEKNLHQFKIEILKFVSDQKIDLIIGNNEPGNLLKLMFYIHCSLGTIYISDIRDFDNFLLLKKKPRFTLRQKIYLLTKYYWIKRWLKKSILIISASEGISEALMKNNLNSKIIYNGYTNDVIDIRENYKPSNEPYLTIGVLGTLYHLQNFSVFIEGFNKFTNQKSKHIRLIFIGGKEITNQLKVFIDQIPKEFIILTQWFEPKKSKEELFKCDLFLYFGWNGYRGIYSAKIFTYLGLKKNIIICPDDNDVLSELIIRTNSGVIVNESDVLVEVLNSYYLEKINSGNISYHGIDDEINKYNRNFQSDKFYSLVNDVLIKKQ